MPCDLTCKFHLLLYAMFILLFYCCIVVLFYCYYLEAGADLEVTDVLGRTPLIAACVGGHIEVCEIISAAGGNINTQDSDGVSPLIATTSKGNEKMNEAMGRIAVGLINRGGCNVNLDLKNKHRKTALMCAIDSGQADIVLALRKAGAQ